MGLREIKRRASRHALVHREYSSAKPPHSQPGTPAEPMPPMQEGADPRVNTIEHTLYDLTSRLQRTEENFHHLQVKQHAVMDTVTRLLQFNHDLSQAVLALAPSPDNPIHRDGTSVTPPEGCPPLPSPVFPCFFLICQAVCILILLSSIFTASRCSTADGDVPSNGGAARTPVWWKSPVLCGHRECACLAPAAAPGRLAEAELGGPATSAAELLSTSRAVEPVDQHSASLRLHRREHHPVLALGSPHTGPSPSARAASARQRRAPPQQLSAEAYLGRHQSPRLAESVTPAEQLVRAAF